MRFDKWDIAGFDRKRAAALCKNDNNNNHNNHLLYVLLTSRGFDNPDDVKAFLNTRSTPLHDPFLMTDIDKAAQRIWKAVDGKETVAIYGDYDVDGMTATAMLALWFDSRDTAYEIYIPGRYDEGYGLNCAALDTLKKRGVSLVVTVDCGITAVSEAQYAKDIGLDLIITDHHECKDSLPEAIAVIDPKRDDCKYKFDTLAGVGVVFKLICALEKDTDTELLLSRYGHLTALGTVADVMPVIDENRRLVMEGLHTLNSNPPPGLRMLIDESCTSGDKVTATTISYVLAPRLNAAGRMADPLLSVKLLLCSDESEAALYVKELCRLNDERRRLEQEILDEALAQLTGIELTTPVILAGDGWFQGVTGIVAAKLADRFGLPVVVISIDKDGLSRGSCRSYGSFSIYDALCTCDDILINFGGHEMAAGITLASNNIEQLRQRITDYYLTHYESTEAAGLQIDFEAEKPEQLLTIKQIEALEQLEPYGRGNSTPCICITEATLTAVTSVGAGKHSKLIIEKDGAMFDCIFFSVSPQDLGVSTGDFVDIAFEPQINEFRDRKRVQLQVIDIKKAL